MHDANPMGEKKNSAINSFQGFKNYIVWNWKLLLKVKCMLNKHFQFVFCIRVKIPEEPLNFAKIFRL